MSQSSGDKNPGVLSPKSAVTKPRAEISGYLGVRLVRMQCFQEDQSHEFLLFLQMFKHPTAPPRPQTWRLQLKRELHIPPSPPKPHTQAQNPRRQTVSPKTEASALFMRTPFEARSFGRSPRRRPSRIPLSATRRVRARVLL